jgi:hypothetical protein
MKPRPGCGVHRSRRTLRGGGLPLADRRLPKISGPQARSFSFRLRLPRRRDVSAGLAEFFLQLGVRPVEHGATRDEQEIAVRGHAPLMVTEDFPEAALGAIALDGGADSRGRGDHADARLVGFGWGQHFSRIRDGSGGDGFPPAPPKREGAAFNAAALFAHAPDIALTPQMLLGAEAHGSRGRRTRTKKRGRSDDRQALTTFQTTGFDDFASAFGGHTGTITDLVGALFAVRAECWLHDF